MSEDPSAPHDRARSSETSGSQAAPRVGPPRGAASTRWVDARIDTAPQQIVGSGDDRRAPRHERPRQAPAPPPQQLPGARHYTVPTTRDRAVGGASAAAPSWGGSSAVVRPKRRPRWWVLHVVMLTAILLLLVVPFVVGLASVAVDPADDSWVWPLLLAWLLAVLLIPILIAWSIVRGVLWRDSTR